MAAALATAAALSDHLDRAKAGPARGGGVDRRPALPPWCTLVLSMHDREAITRAMRAVRNCLPPCGVTTDEAKRLILLGEPASASASERVAYKVVTSKPALHLLELVSGLTPWLGTRYEAALAHAIVGRGHETTTHCLKYDLLDRLVSYADRDRLRTGPRAVPKDLAGGIRFCVYRGVGGKGRYRRVKGYSWSADRERALWFANKARAQGYADPAVYVLRITDADVLFYCDERQEREFIIDRLRVKARPRRLPIVLDKR